MDSDLLRSIRSTRSRFTAEVQKNWSHHPVQRRIFGSLKALTPIFDIPLFVSGGIRFYLPSRIRPNSKTATIIKELAAAGIPPTAIWTPDRSKRTKLNRLAHGLYHLPWAISLLLSISRRAPLLPAMERQIILSREIYRRLLKRYPKLHPIIISDISPDRHTLWSASAMEGCRALWWQDDYHHTDPLLFPVQAAAVLNQGGFETAQRASPSALIVRRPSLVPTQIRPIPRPPRLGLATNAFFGADRSQRELLERIRTAINVPKLILRLHPNSRLSTKDFPEAWIEIAPLEEKLEQFAARIDVAVVGNSAVQLKLLCAGVPVLHLPGLDTEGYDHHGYVRKGFTYGASNIAEAKLEDILRHYRNPALPANISDYVSVREEAGLDGLARLPSFL